ALYGASRGRCRSVIAPATRPAEREEGEPHKRGEPGRPAAALAREPTPRGRQPALVPEPAMALQPPPAPVRVENIRSIEIERFVPRAQIDPRYYDAPYYVTPRDQVGQEAYVAIRDSIRREGVVGMGRVVLAKRERPIIIEPLGKDCRVSRFGMRTRFVAKRTISRTYRN